MDTVSEDGVIGWAVDSEHSEVPVEVVILVDGAEHGRCTADIDRPGLGQHLGPGFSGRYEFRYLFTPGLHVRHDTTIVVLAAATRIALQNGRRVLRGATPARASLMPILLSSRGRAGTTMLMSEFARHREIAVGDTYPYEIKHASYYAAALQVLELAGLGDDPDFAENAEKDWKIGGNPSNHQDINIAVGGDRLVWLFQESIPPRISALFRQFALDAYGIMAIERGKVGARFFAEKTSLRDNVRYGLRKMFGEVREVVLVRDPRDYMCSAKAFWQQSSREVLDLLEITIPLLEDIHQRAESDTIFVRYEDLITQPVETRRRIYKFIGAAEIAAETPGTEVLQGHATSSSPAASVGRWKQELSPEEAAACARQFASFMSRFGYVS